MNRYNDGYDEGYGCHAPHGLAHGAFTRVRMLCKMLDLNHVSFVVNADIARLLKLANL